MTEKADGAGETRGATVAYKAPRDSKDFSYAAKGKRVIHEAMRRDKIKVDKKEDG